MSVLSLCFLFPAGCKSSSQDESTQSATAAVKDTLPQDFITFFDRFHADSAFQYDHINFPLEGLPNSSGDTLAESSVRYFWQREDWRLHHPFTDPSHQFEQWFEVIGDRVIEHWVHMKGTNLYLHRRFAKIQGDWDLIYYAGMRPNSAKLKEQEAAGEE